MAFIVTLEVIAGPRTGAVFRFDQYDTFLFGRAAEAHCSLPDDPYISRNHFLVEINPPHVVARDLGSLNGILVSGKQIGGRQGLEPGGLAPLIQTPVYHGDKIICGQTTFTVRVEDDSRKKTQVKIRLARQPHVAGAQDKPNIPASPNAIPIAPPAKPSPPTAPIKSDPLAPPLAYPISLEPQKSPRKKITCARCGQDATGEVQALHHGEYICGACRQADSASLNSFDPAAASYMNRRIAGKDQLAEAPEIPGYVMTKLLGKGGMGAVYLAESEDGASTYALKVMLPNVAASEDAAKAFQREIQITEHLRHENIVEFHDNGYVDGVFYFILEYVSGGSVTDLMKSLGGVIPLRQAVPIIRGTLRGLAYAHQKGFVHRDLKPQNILLEPDGKSWLPKIGDFGLAKNFQMAGMSGLTITGSMGGTPIYMPPEQITHYKYVYPTSDVFSIGATFYHMLTGCIPYDLSAQEDPLNAILQGRVIPVQRRDPNLPPKLIEIINRSIHPDRNERFMNAAAMETALASALNF